MLTCTGSAPAAKTDTFSDSVLWTRDFSECPSVMLVMMICQKFAVDAWVVSACPPSVEPDAPPKAVAPSAKYPVRDLVRDADLLEGEYC